MTYTLIDPPITPYSTPEAISEWIAWLQAMPQDSPQVQAALADARRLLDRQERRRKQADR